MEKHFGRYNRKILALYNIQREERLTKCFTFNSISSPSPPAKEEHIDLLPNPNDTTRRSSINLKPKLQLPTPKNKPNRSMETQTPHSVPERFCRSRNRTVGRSTATESGAFIKDFEGRGLTPSSLSRRWDVWKICGSPLTCTQDHTAQTDY